MNSGTSAPSSARVHGRVRTSGRESVLSAVDRNVLLEHLETRCFKVVTFFEYRKDVYFSVVMGSETSLCTRTSSLCPHCKVRLV